MMLETKLQFSQFELFFLQIIENCAQLKCTCNFYYDVWTLEMESASHFFPDRIFFWISILLLLLWTDFSAMNDEEIFYY